MNTFSFRAECQDDLTAFKKQCRDSGLIFTTNEKSVENFPDVNVELKVQANLEVIRDVMDKVVDGYVMLQTLRECPLSQNSLERDYDLRRTVSTVKPK